MRAAFLNVLALFVVVGVMSESREEAGKPPPLPQSQKSEKKLKERRPLKGAKSAIWLHFGLRVVEAELGNNKEVECWHYEAAVKDSGNTTNLAADLVKWHKGMKIELPTKSCTAKQVSLGDVSIRVVPRKKLSSKLKLSLNIVNRYNT